MNTYVEELIRQTTKTSKYLKWYVDLMTTRVERGSTKLSLYEETDIRWAERHHILPQCICKLDKDNENNLVV